MSGATTQDAGAHRSPEWLARHQRRKMAVARWRNTAADMLKDLRTIPLAHQPGTFWEYSISIDVLGLLRERVTKKNLDAVLSEMLIYPLGMKDSGWWAGAWGTSFWIDPKEKRVGLLMT